MSERKRLEEQLSGMSPADGFHVEQVQCGDEVSLHLVWRHEGNVVAPFWRKQQLTDKDHGERARLTILTESLCRFINSGGAYADLDRAVTTLRDFTGASELQSLPGYYLIDSAINTAGEYEHVFASDTSSLAIRWVEDSFIDVISLEDFHTELEDDGAGSSAAGDCDSDNQPETGISFTGPVDSGDDTDAGDDAADRTGV